MHPKITQKRGRERDRLVNANKPNKNRDDNINIKSVGVNVKRNN